MTFDLSSVRTALDSAPDAPRLRPVGLRQVITGPDALATLPATVSALKAHAAGVVVVLADHARITHQGGDLVSHVAKLLATCGPVRVTRLGPVTGGAHADEDTVAASVHAAAGAAIVVTVGSGTLSDLGKIACAGNGGRPHVIVQTAASVNGFADDQSVLLIDGVKRTVPSRWPDALLIDPEVIAGAPPAMNLAGVGDLVSMYTAPADWYLAAAIGIDDSYSATLVSMVRPHGDRLLDIAADVAVAKPAALEELAQLLTLSGITMGAAGRTAVSSGMEHTVSHLVEMAVGGAGLHGAQVGVATLVAARTWRHVRNAIDAGQCTPRPLDPDEQQAKIETAFGAAAAAECWRSYRRKLDWLRARPTAVEDLLLRWRDHDAVLDTLLVDPDRLAAALAATGMPTRFSELAPAVDARTARWAVANCHLMRDRFGIADLADLLGIWHSDAVESVLW